MISKFRNAKGFTLVELMIVVAIIGILAAIAIPAFLRYIKSSKSAEAESIMKKMADGAKGYFTSEQKYSAPSGGDQPWHGAGSVGTNTAPGLPVTWASYVFPGGPSFGLNSTEVSCADGVGVMPSGGSKYQACGGTQVTTTESTTWAALNKLRVTMQDPMYFMYEYNSNGAATSAQATIKASHDFNAADATVFHNVTQIVSIDPISQEVKVSPAVLLNEFE